MGNDLSLDIVRLYEDMYFIRRVEEYISTEYSRGEMRTPVHLAVGQELLPAFFAQLLSARDLALSGHRSHGHYLSKGGDLVAFFGEILGKEIGCSRGRGGSQHLIDLEKGFVASAPILGAMVAIGVGCAWQLKLTDEGMVVVVYFGDAAIEEGIVYEAMSFASLHKLPVIFACENNMYSTHIHISRRQPQRPFSDFALGVGMKTVHLTGQSHESQFMKLSSAVLDTRKGMGPCFVLMDTYRYLEHVGPNEDVNLGYRSQSELDEWKSKDPLSHISKDIISMGLVTQDQLRVMHESISKMVEEAYGTARSARNANPVNVFSNIYPGEMYSSC